jgi:hypothetical protein
MPPKPVPDKPLLDRLLAGECPPVTYAELHGVLSRIQGYAMLPPEPDDGPYREWKHAACPEFLQLRENGGKAMHAKYVEKAVRHLQKVKALGGF